MDIKTLEKFFDYASLKHDPQVLLENIIQKAKKYLPDVQIPSIYKAYEYAAQKHA
jgi:hypothetical protein